MEPTTLTGSNIPVKTHIVDAVKPLGKPLSSDPSWFVTWQGNGNITLNINCGAIYAASNVMVSISEYWDVNNAVNTRFMGAARFAINNICPRDGGMVINMDIDWASPIYIYISILIS